MTQCIAEIPEAVLRAHRREIDGAYFAFMRGDGGPYVQFILPQRMVCDVPGPEVTAQIIRLRIKDEWRNGKRVFVIEPENEATRDLLASYAKEAEEIEHFNAGVMGALQKADAV